MRGSASLRISKCCQTLLDPRRSWTEALDRRTARGDAVSSFERHLVAPGREEPMSIQAQSASATFGSWLKRIQVLTPLPGVFTAGTLLLAYLGLEWVSFIHEYKGLPVTPWNPGVGLVFAILILKGPYYGTVLFLGVVIAEIFVLGTKLELPVIITMAAIIATSFTISAAVLRYHLRLDVSLTHVREVLVLFAGGLAAAVLSATLLSALLLVLGELTTADLTTASLSLLVGDIIGIGVVTPLVLRLFLYWSGAKIRPELIAEGALLLLLIGSTLWMVVTNVPSNYNLLSFLFLPVLAAALRHGIDGSCMSLAATQLGLVALLYYYGYDAAAFTEFQLGMLVLTISGLIVGVVVSERQRADLAARLAEARVKDMQAEAQRAARMNLVSGMASALAHEVNQPLTAARALARSIQHMLHSQEPDSRRLDDNLTALVTQIDHAGRVVHRTREFLRRRRPHSSTLDVRAILEEAIALARPDAADRPLVIEAMVSDPLPPVFGDRVQLQQVVLNLLHNAMESIAEARPRDGRIRIGARRSGDAPMVEISVLDNGGGVASGSTLFEPLSSSKKDGLGLGLSICASIVQAHGGRIWLQSGEPGNTEFRFCIPSQGRS
jgi:two-component system sensor kinase FixL